jgi:hypothetical protein
MSRNTPTTTKAKPPAKLTGRPSVYSRELVAIICGRMAGGETLTSICRAPGMPAHSTVRLWAIEDRDGFSARYARAREAQAHAIAEGALDGAQRATDAALGRLEFDAKRWFAGKMLPRVYGERPEPAKGTLENPIVLLLQQVQARALPVVPCQVIEAEEGDEANEEKVGVA